jgi:hypothetical protein
MTSAGTQHSNSLFNNKGYTINRDKPKCSTLQEKDHYFLYMKKQRIVPVILERQKFILFKYSYTKHQSTVE